MMASVSRSAWSFPRRSTASIPDDQPRLKGRCQIDRARQHANGKAMASATPAIDLADKQMTIGSQSLGMLHRQRLRLLDFAAGIHRSRIKLNRDILRIEARQ